MLNLLLCCFVVACFWQELLISPLFNWRDICLFFTFWNVRSWRRSADLALLRRLWRWLDATVSSRVEHSRREEVSVRRASERARTCQASMPSPYLDGFLSLLIILLSCCSTTAKIKEQGLEANCCSSILCSRQPEGPKALFLHCG